MRLALKVTPGASRDEIAGWMGGALKVRVTAAAQRGRANAAVEKLLAAALGVPGAAVRIVAGHTAPRKLVEIEGLSAPEVRRRLGVGR